MYFRPDLVDKAVTPWYFKSFWKKAFADLAAQWPNLTDVDDLPASRLGTMLLTRYFFKNRLKCSTGSIL